jgi:hypothetical protein
MTRTMTFADICERARPTRGNARALYVMAESDADLHELCAMGADFDATTRRELGNAIVRAWIARGRLDEARAIARDPAYRDLVSTEALRRCGASDEIAHRKRKGMQPINIGAMLDEDDEIDRTIAYGEMPGGGR